MKPQLLEISILLNRSMLFVVGYVCRLQEAKSNYSVEEKATNDETKKELVFIIETILIKCEWN